MKHSIIILTVMLIAASSITMLLTEIRNNITVSPVAQAPEALAGVYTEPTRRINRSMSTNMRSTGLFLNWKRPANLKAIIANLREQAYIWVWNNGVQGNFDADVQINSSVNFLSYPRWLMATQPKTEFVFVHDDDLMVTTPIKEIEEYMDTLPKDAILGCAGVTLVKGKGYWSSRHRPRANGTVDIVKGRFMFLRTELLRKVYLKPAGLTRGDDIYISSFSTHKELPKFIHKRNLPTGQEGLMKQSGHRTEREKAVEAYFERQT